MFTDSTVLMADSVRKLKEFLEKTVTESKNKGITIDYKKTKSIVVSKRDILRCELRIGKVKIKQIQNLIILLVLALKSSIRKPELEH